ncbi:hypothetical protein LV84_00117 [Algoriphagus ratkowskyi]|uniref:Uncharacterized protein n=1 Tax=Algoriphagus ratkowskyi TaxID=57028 RepID=A0A2W7S2H5_9BACT|nr:hypothetical protein [Algoriphagus ratkowskyi]PZX61129.1 hypothetical protein LV84_00117 [Algoriphagus ratkowskyi]TXD79257.1 hypothetical protein ESW18_03195 [Algoriphagus ratkowskyi]
MKKNLLIFLLFLPLFSCETGDEDPIIDNEPEVPSQGPFTVNIPSTYLSTRNEVWLILHDLDGKPIDYAKVDAAGETEFDVDREKRYHLSLFMRNMSSDMDINFIQTFTNIKVTRNINFGLAKAGRSTPAPTGNFDVTIKLNDYGNSAYASSSFNTYQTSSYNLEYDIHLTTPLYANEKKYLVSVGNSSGQTRYTFLTDPEKDKSYSFNFESLKSYDKTIKIENLSSTYLYYSVNAMIENNGFYVPSYLVSSNKFGSPSRELGYLNEFKIYSTRVEASPQKDAKTTSHYYKLGDVPEKINFLNIPEIQVQKKEITDFSFSLSPEATDFVVVFDYPNLYSYPEPIKNVRWFVRGNTSSFGLELPAEIKTTYPLLSDLSKMQVESIDIIKSSTSYDQYIVDEFVEVPTLKKVEILSIRQSYPKN